MPHFTLWLLKKLSHVSKRLGGDASIYLDNSISKGFILVSRDFNNHTKQRAAAQAEHADSWVSCMFSLCSAALALKFTWCFSTTLSVLSAWPVNTARLLRWRRYIARANPRGCCPLCHLSSLCCRLSVSDKLPGLPHWYGWHTRWLVCMSVCACYEVNGCQRPAAWETARFPAAACCATACAVCCHTLSTLREGEGKQKQQQRGDGNQYVQRAMFWINYVTVLIDVYRGNIKIWQWGVFNTISMH